MGRSLEALVERSRDAHPVCGGLSLAVGDCRIRIESSSPALVRYLERYYAEYLAHEGSAEPLVSVLEAPPAGFPFAFRELEREPGKARLKEAFADLPGGRVVRKVRTGMHFLIGEKARVALGPCEANPNQVINFVNFQYAAWLLERGWQLCHAAGAVRDGRGLGLAGFSGGGKSTLALHLLSRGLDYASNDRLLVHREGDGARMSGIPKLPRINPGTALGNRDLTRLLSEERRRELADLDEDALWELEEKYDVPIGEVYGPGRVRLTATLAAFAVLAWDRASDEPARIARVDLRERRDLLAAIVKSPGPFWLPREGPAPTGSLAVDAEPYLEQLAPVPTFEIAGGVDFAAAADACLDALAGAGPA